MCKANSDAVVKTDSRVYGTGPEGDAAARAGYPGVGVPGVGTAPKPKAKPTGLDSDFTSKALQDARVNEAMRLRARRGRKSSFLAASTDWEDQKNASMQNPFPGSGLDVKDRY
jgi:hypothetical protein